MIENLQMVELSKSLAKIKELTEKVEKSFQNADILVKENINTGNGVWDSDSAKLWKEKWENLREDFPAIVETFHQQESNLETFIENMKKTEEQ
ncbi:MAG: hypothetical protein J6X28_04970 [Bacilli bacterium]|nr:hypothetical protein [Bacilli bacterium]